MNDGNATRGWTKSSFSSHNGNCVEVSKMSTIMDDGNVASGWTRSSFSIHTGNCVEVSDPANDVILVRDSKNPSVMLDFTTAEWGTFIGGVRGGEFSG